MQAEVEQHLVFRVLGIREIPPNDDFAGEHAVEHRAAQWACGARREDLVRSAACRRHRAGGLTLDEDDRRSLERDEAAYLADEGAERLLDLERRSERAGAAVRRLEEVDAAAERIAQAFGLGRRARRPGVPRSRAG